MLTGKQITMTLISASSEFCGSTRSMSKVMSDYLISQICIVGRNIISLNMKSRICCDYRTTILSNLFFHATTLLSIYHEKFFQ